MTRGSDQGDTTPTQGALIGIGALSAATGVPSETLRTWERRYGVPVASRTDGGHRLYPASAIDFIRLVARALEQGLRASQATRLDIVQLQELTSGTARAEQRFRLAETASPSTAPGAVVLSDVVVRHEHRALDACFQAMLRFDRLGFDALLVTERERLGSIEFMESLLLPLLFEIGNAWTRGEISEAPEHFASEAIRDVLGEMWRRVGVAVNAPVALLSTLPGEHHDLGLHMAAVVSVQAGCRLVFLGRSTPVKSIARAARDSGASWVVVSVSSATEAGEARVMLSNLRSELDHQIVLLVGGVGAPSGLSGIESFHSLTALRARLL